MIPSSFQSHTASTQNCLRSCRRAARWAHIFRRGLFGQVAKLASYAAVRWRVIPADGDLVEVDGGFCMVRGMRERVHSRKRWLDADRNDHNSSFFSDTKCSRSLEPRKKNSA